MNDIALISTRKGLMIMDRDGAAWHPREMAFPGTTVTLALRDPHDGAIYAALKHGHFGPKLHRSDDDGKNWIEITPPAFPEGTDGKPALIQIWALEAEPGTIWAGGVPAGLFRSNDRGMSWTLVDALWNQPSRAQWFGGGNDAPAMHSVLIDPRTKGNLTVAISCAGVWKSPDAGESWSVEGRGQIATYMPPEKQGELTAQDPHRVVRCASQPDRMWMQHHCGVFRSDDAGLNWTKLTPPVSEFGFVVAAHPKDPDTAWFVPAISDEQRMVKDGAVRVTVTHDGGKSWNVLEKGLPQKDAYELIYRHGLDVDRSGEHLIMGSTTGALWASSNAGENWSLVNAHLPPIYAVRFG